MADRRASVNFDRIAERYDVTRGGERRGERAAEDLSPLLGRSLPAGVPLLEIGVGTGIVARSLGRRGRPVVGVDLSVGMLQHARDRLGQRVARADAQALPVADRSVQVAYSVWVLHLVADVASVLAEVARVLVPGGRYAVLCSRGHRVDATDTEALSARLHEAVDPPQGRQDHPDRLHRLAPAAGLVVTDVRWTEAEPYASSPNQDADGLEQRTWSALWEVSEAAFDTQVRPVIEAMRALPEPDRPREHLLRHALVLLRRPQ